MRAILLAITCVPQSLKTGNRTGTENMPKPSEHKTVQARILKYAEKIGWIFVPHEDGEARRGFDPVLKSILAGIME